MELQKLSIAEKPRLSQDTDTPRKNGGINLSLDLQRSHTDNAGSDGDDREHEQLLYALASKKRHISELEHELKIARKDVKGLEEQWRSHAASKQPTSSLQHWHNKLQKSVEGGGLLQSLVSKFSELTQVDDAQNEEAEFDKWQDRKQEGFYLKNKFDYDDDEEVEEEETGGTLVGQEKAFRR